MNWSEYLHENEEIVWQGRPAPRCFTFRNWIHSLFGVVILIASIGWVFYGLHLGKEHNQVIFALIPVPFLLVGVYLSFGHLILARLEWERVFYAMTDKRLLATRGLLKLRVESLDLADVVYFHLKPLGAELGTVRVQCREREERMTVSCVEYPRQLTGRLETVMEENGVELQAGGYE
jgi:hypothetical protein